MQMQEVFQMLQYLLATNSVDIVAGDFNFDLLKASGNNLLLNHFMEHVQIVEHFCSFCLSFSQLIDSLHSI